MNKPCSIKDAIEILHQGGIIGYPTESCYGLGCDPNHKRAVKSIYELKQRDMHKPMILIVSEWRHLEQLHVSLSTQQLEQLRETWPGPTTWLIKSRHPLAHNGKIAIRMVDHPIAKALCDQWNGPLISTSANLSDMRSATTIPMLIDYFDDQIDGIVAGDVGDRSQPSRIIDLETLTQLR